MIILIIILGIGFVCLLCVAVVVLAYFLLQDRQSLKKYAGVSNLETEQNRIRKESKKYIAENERLKTEGKALREAVTNLKIQLVSLEDEQELQNFGVYQPKYDFGTSAGYKAKLGEIRQKQKALIKGENAIIWGTQWHVEGSKAKGKTMMKRLTRLTLRAFNGECDSVVSGVKYNNVERVKARIESVYKAINKLNASQNCQINPHYLDLKVQELYLVHEYQEKLQAEKEEQREIRIQMREEQRAQKEVEKVRRDAEKAEKLYEKALNKARTDVERATGERQAQLRSEIERLSQALNEAHEKKERAISRAQMTKSGHVYIVSNVGSFGEDIYKIGMTRRLDPMDRVKELGDASVPFLFDTHAIIYSEDARELESYLHKTFDSRRLNLVNSRKEFFRVPLEDIVRVVRGKSVKIEFTMKAKAEEYRKTQAILVKNNMNKKEPSANLYDELFNGEK